MTIIFSEIVHIFVKGPAQWSPPPGVEFSLVAFGCLFTFFIGLLSDWHITHFHSLFYDTIFILGWRTHFRYKLSSLSPHFKVPRSCQISINIIFNDLVRRDWRSNPWPYALYQFDLLSCFYQLCVLHMFI